ncbi:AraC family transcriptional regulator [Priestia megaterium]|uniref:AraC family transcriptional regulator n=1 Tax=Priestia megaterium TaxID=1404 RepID=UPI001BEC82FB|nr:helix-turn-helix transcriptional regulator [Priestia megaterium]MBT2281710.1 AraC family transcriptional regulator [Priestia megaterium]MED4265313.1 helix-turn-helix transcriptional regulator [Priestia megaterium]MED4279865.1 helix-turn-helix transcriptional regulator [Priestia megaterium]MED4319504.1 helix-turn-helix transcriptional regulator [Priestia megaterium]
MVRISKQKINIERLKYQPVLPYPYDLEIFRVSDLKQRTPKERMSVTYRYEFYMLICVTQGDCIQWVDFEPISCSTGTLLAISPGQVHNFGHDENWDGWIILFRSEFLIPNTSTLLAFDFGRLPNILNLNNNELRRGITSIERMIEDSLIEGAEEDVHMLLRYQLYAFVTWLSILHKHKQMHDTIHSQTSLRFTNFQKLVEKYFDKFSHVSEYAIRLNCTEKTLTRATKAAVGTSAKAFISARINLEAKRLLMHTDYSISDIAEKLNFKEATHFSKFFKRETGCTPAEFRQQHLGNY